MKFFNLEQKITLLSFDVTFYDRRDAKPRPVHHERVVLNGGRLSALERLGLTPSGWIAQQFEGQGYSVAQVKKGETLNAQVDLNALWARTAAELAVQRLGAGVAKLARGEDKQA